MSPQSPQEREKQLRICVALWAYAYEIMSDPLVSDARFDTVCKEIDLMQSTGNAKMDIWFQENFSPDTGQWIWTHPGLERLQQMYKRWRQTTQGLIRND